MYDIKSMSISELKDLLLKLGEPAYRARQIFSQLQSGAERYDEMTSLPKTLRDLLAPDYPLYVPKVLVKQVASDGTVKLLWELQDGHSIESVVMSYKHGNTVCISTQVGCRMGCVFCASTKGGLVRNLLPSEMLDQVRFSGKESGKPISNIVLMGIGEPLDNFDHVLRFLQLVNDPAGMNIGMRHISLSTSGLKGGIRKLAELDLQLTLSVSLHAPDDETRSALMPVNRAVGVQTLIDDCKDYCLRTGRRISFEYILAEGINDSPEHAKTLTKLLQGMGRACAPLIHVNLIPLNPTPEALLRPTSRVRAGQFAEELRSSGIPVTLRRRMGSEINAACGQLRRGQNKE